MKQFLTSGLRFLSRRKLTTLISMVSLVLGLTSTLLFATWVENELSFDRFTTHFARDRLLRSCK